MAKSTRYKVRCTLCKEEYQNDYNQRHTKAKHKDLHQSGRCAPTTIVLEDVRQQRKLDFFLSPGSSRSVEPAASKKRRLQVEEFEEQDDSGNVDSPGKFAICQFHTRMLNNLTVEQISINNNRSSLLPILMQMRS